MTNHGNHLHGHNPSNGKPSPTYNSWCAMKRRCKRNEYYTSRNITYCEEWETFCNFLSDMGERPEGMTLGRIDNDGNYCPENCRWETKHQQDTNRRSTIVIEYNGVSQCVRDWHRQTGLSERCITHRYHLGWTPERILTTPSRKQR